MENDYFEKATPRTNQVAAGFAVVMTVLAAREIYKIRKDTKIDRVLKRKIRRAVKNDPEGWLAFREELLEMRAQIKD
ncbi:MAG: hypothetical protein ABW007_28320 [Chitinophagaceae bacterium]